MSRVGTLFLFFKQTAAYGLGISDWSSDLCSSDLGLSARIFGRDAPAHHARLGADARTAAADRRRTDDRARHAQPARGARTDGGADARDGDGAAAHHPRPRPRRPIYRPDRKSVV